MIKNRSKLEWNGEYGYQVYIKNHTGGKIK